MARVKRLLPAVCIALTIAAVGPAPALAQSTPSPSPAAEAEIEVPEPVPGEPQCTITDGRLQSLSGLAVLDDGTYAVVNDGQQPNQPIFLLNAECQVIDEIWFPGGTRDPEDLAYDRDNQILWVGDTGDKFETSGAEPRPSVALWRVDLSGGDRTPLIHRFAYPDGARDAEGLILDSDGTPIIVTRSIGTSELFRPAAEMVPNNPHEQAVPLERIGEFSPPDTGTEHPLGRSARQAVTGGANSPDGDRVVLRTYTDAFEFDVDDGDVAGAITDGTPRVTPLPDEPMGESIAYSPDGEYFLTVSETAQEAGVDPVILRYTPTEPAPEPPPETEAPGGEPEAVARSLLDRLGPQGIINLIAGVGVLGLLMVVAGVFGIVRARRRPPEADEWDDDEQPDGDDGGGGAVRPGAPASARARVTPPPPGEARGHPPAGPQPGLGQSGTVYSAGGGQGYGQGQPFDQDHPHGYDDGYGAGPPPPERGGTYSGGTYSGGTYSGGGYSGGAYEGGTYQGGQGVPDYYSDDPDYSYEFRERDNW